MLGKQCIYGISGYLGGQEALIWDPGSILGPLGGRFWDPWGRFWDPWGVDFGTPGGLDMATSLGTLAKYGVLGGSEWPKSPLT